MKSTKRNAARCLGLVLAVGILAGSALGLSAVRSAASGEASAENSMAAREIKSYPREMTERGNITRAYSSMGYEGDGYEAIQAWETYFWSDHEADRDVLLDTDSPYRYYGLGYQGLAGRLDTVAEEYGLRLYESQTLTNSVTEFYELLALEPFMAAEPSYAEGCSGTVYDDGSFDLSAVTLPAAETGAGTDVAVSVFRAVKGSFSDFLLLGDAPESYVYESYETASGVTVDAALGLSSSFLFAEPDGCYVSVLINGGSDPGEYLPALDMADIQAVADSIDFAALAVSRE